MYDAPSVRIKVCTCEEPCASLVFVSLAAKILKPALNCIISPNTIGFTFGSSELKDLK